MAKRDDSDGNLPADFIRPVLTLKQLWVMMWAYRFWIAALCVVAVVATAIYSKMTPKTYEATATLLLAFQVDDPLSGKEFSAMLASSYMSTQIEFIQSPPTLFGAVDKLRLYENPDYIAGYFGNGSATSVREWAMHALAMKIGVDKGKESRFIYVSADDHDPVMAAKLANAVAEAYVEEQRRQVLEPAKERAEQVAQQLEGLKKKVDDAQQAVTEFRVKSGMLSLQDTGDTDSLRLMDLEKRLADARSVRQAADERLKAVAEGDAAVLGSPLIQNLKNQLQQKESEMAELQSSLGTRHPQYVAVKAEIDHTRQQLNREISVYQQGARDDANKAHVLEGQLSAEYDRQRQKSLADRSATEEGARLVRELESATSEYQASLANYQKVLTGSQLPTDNVSIVTQATPPVRHIKPIARKNVIMAAMMSLFLGVGGSLLLDLFNRRVRCREDLERDLGTPVLAELASSKA